MLYNEEIISNRDLVQLVVHFIGTTLFAIIPLILIVDLWFKDPIF